MNILKRDLAPLTDGAWQAIEDEARRTLKGNLSGRRMVEVSEPRGLDFAAVNLGRLETGDSSPVKGVEWGVRKVQPLTEIRVPFSLDIWELDNIERGSVDPDLDPVAAAAQKAALFEETAIYRGFDPGCIRGLLAASPHKDVGLPKAEAAKMPAAVEAAIVAIEKAGIAGPYALALGTKAYQMLMAGSDKGYPVVDRVRSMLEGGIHWSPALACGAVVSKRGGDFEYTLGQDMAVGYQGATAKKVHLYLTESFTFRVLEPRAAVGITWQA